MDLRKIRRVICLQRESSDCGVACLLTLLRFFGAESSMYRLREESGITPSGTSLLALYRTAIRYGLKADAVEASEDWLFQQKDPVLLHVELENQRQHYVIWWQRDQDKSLIFDPACGLVKWSDEKLRTLWKSRYGMRVASGTCREQARQTATGRKQWIRSMVRPYIPAFMVNVTIGLLIAATGISVNLFIQKLIDTWLPDRLLVSLAMASALLLVLLTVRACMAAFRNWMMARVANRMDRRMMAEMYPNLLNKPLSFFEQRKVGDLMSRLADIRRIRTTFTDVIGGSLVINLLLVLSALVGISLYAPLLALFSAVLSLLFFAILWHYSLEIKDRHMLLRRHRSIRASTEFGHGS